MDVSWTIKKVEPRITHAFELWCWRRLLRDPWNCREIQLVNPRGNQSWIFIRRTDAEAETTILSTWCEELTYLKRSWCWERLKVGGEGDSRGWDGWMASPTQGTLVWVGSGCWWLTGRPDMLPSMGLQRVRHDWVTELNWYMYVTTHIDGKSFYNLLWLCLFAQILSEWTVKVFQRRLHLILHPPWTSKVFPVKKCYENINSWLWNLNI